ncbi:hypothetical protein SAMN04488008_101608 [Maribacter orientalis]|uniref:Uncharacterized protein n=1 Tax=Maribacter orientalis TaxID=228957 RepID=A0A1H7HKI4_9FLAO|nr:hypothetical protein SAMN04488008_101608 [Maribacter orientalis]
MENLNTALHAPKFNFYISIIERSQVKILALGYQVVMLKSKFKKQLNFFVSAILFNF